MNRLLVAAMLLGGCGGASGVGEMHMAVDGASGLRSSQVGSVAVLVLGGDRADCDHALKPRSPLDDPSLTVLAHALFVVDGSSKRLTGIPAGEKLVFYVDAFDSADGSRPRVGRGCTETTLQAGQAGGVSITLTAASDY
jgi:hypothetical protein